MNILFLSTQKIENANGGSQCAFRNYQAICSYFGKENVRFLQIIYRKQFYFLQLLANKKEIIENVKNIQIIFINESIILTNGCFVSQCRRTLRTRIVEAVLTII